MPTYSWNRAQTQKRVGPGQQLRYAAGQGYWVGPRIGPTRGRPAAQGPLAALIGRLSASHPTPQQQLSLAQQLVNTSLATQKAEVEAQTARGVKEANAQRDAARGFALGLGGLDRANAQQIRDAYGAAGTDMSKFGTALAGALQQSQQGALDQAQGAVTARTGDIVQAVAPSAYANTANFQAELAAAAPKSLAAQYALGGVPSDPVNPNATPLVTPAQARLGSIGEQYVAKAGQTRSDAIDAVAKIGAQRPGLVRQALQDIQSSGRADDAALIQALYLLQTTDKNAFDRAMTVAATTGVYNGKPTVAAKTAAAKAAADRAKAADAAERTRIAGMNATTARMKANIAAANAKTAAAGKRGESTLKLRSQYSENALSYVRQVLGIDPSKPNAKPRNRPPKKAALVRAVYNIYGAPFAGQYGLTESQLKTWANKVVEAMPKDYWSDGYWKKREAAAKAAASSSSPLK